jgi:hypothetical protein
MIWAIKELMYFRSGCRELEDSMETHEVYLEVFDTFFINCHGNVDVTLESFPCLPELDSSTLIVAWEIRRLKEGSEVRQREGPTNEF